MTEATKQLLSFIVDINELKEYGNNINTPVESTFIECLNILYHPGPEELDYDLLLFKINSVLDYLYDNIYTGHWSNVSNKIRQSYAIASFIKVYIMILKSNLSSIENMKDALQVIDMGLLLGSKLNKNKKLLLKSASYLSSKINALSTPIQDFQEDTKKRKRSSFEYKIGSKIIDELTCPSIERFNNEYFTPQLPVKLINCMTHWPAMSKWSDIKYLLSMAGERTVPIELGSQYTDSNWGQKLMTLRKFIEDYFLKKDGETGYLAQYNLFDQVSELRNDIHIPEYCCLRKDYENSDEDVAINAWFGPENTVSPLHSDIKDNILAQVFGTKHLVLFPPSDIEYLYPHEEKMLNFTSRVNPLKPDLDAYPDFKKSTMYECYLEEGDMLFIPSKWWHHVTALEKSFSVNFWWS